MTTAPTDPSRAVPARAGAGSAAAPHAAHFATGFASGWDYDPAPETHRTPLADRHGLFIGGGFIEPRSGEHFASINPATEQTLSQVAHAGAEDVDAAVSAARDAFPAWSAMPGAERGKLLFRLARRIQERARELAVLESLDGGKPIRESRDVDIPLAAAHFFYYAGWADKLGYAFAGATPKPVGVCAQIIPWNFPLLMAAWKLAPALACGNTCVLKPAETTSLTALRLGELIDECGFPKGVVNIITGDGRTGSALVDHPGVDKIAFTGSTEVGRRIAAVVAPTRKRLTLELGGKSANIIFADASLDQAVEGIIQGIYFNQGHVCCAGSRLFVQEPVMGEVLDRLKSRMRQLRVGDPMDKNTDLGAINSRAQLDTIERYLAAGKEECGEESCWQPEADLPSKGYWCPPTVFEGVQPSCTVAREEIFGPVLAVMSFRTPDEALQRANNSRYGLAAGVWTDKGSKVFEIASKLKAGVLWLNTYNRFDPASPFGGYKESGFGREGGMHGLRAYVELGSVDAETHR